MVDFITTLTSGFAQNIVGGFDSQSLEIALIIYALILVVMLLAAAVQMEAVALIIAPIAISGAFAGPGGLLLGSFAGITIVVVGYIWAALIMALIK